MTSVKQTSYCCAIYEMGNLELPPTANGSAWFTHPTKGYGYHQVKTVPLEKWWDDQISRMIDASREMGSGRALPRCIQFADVKGEAGEKWAKAIRKRGYKVDEVSLGNNPKSGNDVVMYLWYPSKRVKREVSLSA